jgi:ubiquinone/menaquinone biosynthesis C-methylase UbiE
MSGKPQPQGNRDRGWDPVAGWYDKLVGDEGSDYHKHIILPAVIRMLAPKKGEAALDLCCGQGVLTPHLLEKGVTRLTGVDASPKLIESARLRHGMRPGVNFLVSDACKPAPWADGSYDFAACVMAVHDVPEIDGLFANLSRSLKPGGRAVIVFMHPCFRVPRQSHWGWDPDHKIQYRRIDRYSSPIGIPIATHPGRDTGELTTFHHRPLATYFHTLGKAGLGVTDCEELHSHRRSQQGPRSRAEHRAAEEFPLFIALSVAHVGQNAASP